MILRLQLKHGVIIVATEADEYKPTEYLYGKNEKVITQTELEEKLANSELSDKSLNDIVMIQCVGSRIDERQYCSRVCCNQAIKNAILIKEEDPEKNITILYRDIRSYGFNEIEYKKARQILRLFGLRIPLIRIKRKSEGFLQAGLHYACAAILKLILMTYRPV